ncbi:Signal transduction histidine kinase [Hoeflea phototrophica DFL-43]|uniref:Oxygen sensor histidine kinase NreB n=1 Tax=Hoeflea phototrophica (strain DSM 17068 / NCIMB 14078 / DFL-43) TaxID=411684 RepID=A9D6Y2_HOEPD|nr:sensor histidine kinase [Hoeflea phototrophica]EDQ33619.2 Signal transduction histidine kinase [Hoeflea phototrophica DFL-43]
MYGPAIEQLERPPGTIAFGGDLSLHSRFAAAGSIVMLIGMVILGWWTSREIEESVVRNSAISTALFMESFVAPLSQQLGSNAALSQDTEDTLREIFEKPPLSERILSVKIWRDGGLVSFATDPGIVGQRFEPSPPLAAAWQGELSAAFDDLNDHEDAAERSLDLPLLEVYNPIHSIYTGEIIAVAEFYQIATELERDLLRARLEAWLLVAGVSISMFALLFGIVRKGSHVIERQKKALHMRYEQLSRFSAQNDALHRRMQAASSGVSELNEQYLKRISAELHDGAAQSVAFASLRLDGLQTDASQEVEASRIKTALSDALSEIRNVCRGLSLPEIDQKDVYEVISMAAQAHEKRTQTTVELLFEGQPGRGFDNAARICIFRFVQEALNNAFRHADGVGQRVQSRFESGRLTVAVVDQGPGFDPLEKRKNVGLGLRGLRERVESQGGTFTIDTAPGRGTRLVMTLAETEKNSDE